jgi:hypothetical protein
MLWYALPWSFAALGSLFVWRSLKARLSRPVQALVLYLLLCAGLDVLVMSIFERLSQRYIFPAYYFLALAGFLVIWSLYSERLERLFAARSKVLIMFVPIWWAFTRLVVIAMNQYLPPRI